MDGDEAPPAKAWVAALLVDEPPDAIVALDRHGRIVSWNPGAQAIFGYSAAEAIGRHIDSLLVPQDHQAEAGRSLAMAVETGSFVTSAVRHRKDGSLLDVEVSMRRVAAIRDIGDRKLLEKAIGQATRLKGDLLAHVSHELRTPLNAIIGFARLMHDGKVGPVSAPHHEYLGDILTSSRHLLRLIDDVLDLAKIESGKMEFHPERVNPVNLAREVSEVLRGLASAKSLSVEVEGESDAAQLASVVVDPHRLKQVLYNYLSNAIKFTPEGGRIVVRVAPEGADLFRVAVEDTGIGVSPSEIGRLFVEFQRVDPSSAPKVEGTGLGLALTKKMVEAQGGRVDVRSVLGRGSTFSALLPRSPTPEGFRPFLVPSDRPENLGER